MSLHVFVSIAGPVMSQPKKLLRGFVLAAQLVNKQKRFWQMRFKIYIPKREAIYLIQQLVDPHGSLHSR
jgi:hypothetical protein